ncbi:hypothetical protein JOE48_003547 [Methylobacterium sp. PvR107]|nr:hypothetical protein [Methylobacterium sp. PvR107]
MRTTPGLLRDTEQGAGFDPIGERHAAAHPQPLALARGDLVADARAGDRALGLDERQQHVAGETPRAGRGVERLGHRHERRGVRVEQRDEPSEVGQGAGEAVDLSAQGAPVRSRREILSTHADRPPRPILCAGRALRALQGWTGALHADARRRLANDSRSALATCAAE